MYHRLGDGPIGREPGEAIYTVRQEVFRGQMLHLSNAGYRVDDLHQLATAAPPVVGQKGVALTFDAGCRSAISVAAPLLAELGLRATFFVTPAWVGTPGFMNWAEVKDLLRLGMTVGAHGLDHTPLRSLSPTELRCHLREARRELTARLGSAPVALSMPGGAGGVRELEAAREEGFQIVAGSVPRRFRAGGTLEVVPRFAVRRSDTDASFRALVAQRPPALLRAFGRHAVLRVLRRTLGEEGYLRLRARWASPADS
jgi:peptidoglycan/xylan/chitin deacetylase (PgdA/CDA1 family)